MTNSKTTKKALLSSALALTMCVAMLIATTFAWFTDTASTSVNRIQAGTLKLKLEKATAWDTQSGNPKTWANANGETLSFLQTDADGNVKESEAILWEPGCTYKLPELKISNEGNLALKYKIIISGIGGNAELNNAIEWTIKNDADGESATDLSKTEYKLTAKEGNNASDILTISGHMKEDAGNAYQGMTINNISITVIATQDTAEFDSTNNQYDYSALYPVYEVATVTTTNTDGTLKVATAVTIESAQKITPTAGAEAVPVATVEVPADVVLDAGTDKLTFDIHETTADNNVEITSAQSKKTLEITVKGVASTNDKPLTIKHYIEPGLTGLGLKHYKSNEWQTMESVESENEVSKDQQYYYDIDTGKLVLMSATFSPFTYVYDAPGTQTVITRAELEAALEDKTVDTIKLGADITLSSVAEVNHDVTLDFNGKTLEAKIDGAQRAIDINACKLIFKDSSENKDGKFVSAYGGVQLWGESPAFELNNITIECTKSYAVQTGYNADAAVAVMNSGKISGGAFNLSSYKWKGTRANVIINKGEINIAQPNVFTGIYVGDSDVTVDGGIFTCAGGSVSIFNVGSGVEGTLVIKNGSFTTNATNPNIKDIFGYYGQGTVKGGTFNVDPADRVAAGYTATKNGDGKTWTVEAAKSN